MIKIVLLGVWFIGAPLHWILIGFLCRLDGSDCGQLVARDSSDFYSLVVQHGPVLGALIGLIPLWRWHRSGESWRMRYAIIALAQIAVAVGYITAYNWDGLNGAGSASDTVRNIGLAVAVVLTLLFVIWRERIASNRADDGLASSLAERYRDGARLLMSRKAIERIAGIYLIQELARESISPGRRNHHYWEMCLNLLDQWRVHRQATGISQIELLTIRAAVFNLRHPQTFDLSQD